MIQVYQSVIGGLIPSVSSIMIPSNYNNSMNSVLTISPLGYTIISMITSNLKTVSRQCKSELHTVQWPSPHQFPKVQ